jgi:hypothetical protein
MPATLDANIQAALIANPDPWGNVITYTPNPVANAVSCTGNTNAFTLTSNGPDGVNGTTDDITINYVNYQLAAPLVAAGKC